MQLTGMSGMARVAVHVPSAGLWWGNCESMYVRADASVKIRSGGFPPPAVRMAACVCL